MNQKPCVQYAAAGITLVFMAGAVLRILSGVLSEFSIDEVWSLYFAEHSKSILEILFFTKHDNNHPLNTILLRYLSIWNSPLLYRLPALLTGLLVPAAGWYLAKGCRTAARTLFALFLASSFLLIFYSSEARGYSLMLFFGLLALICLRDYADSPKARKALLYALCTVLAVLSHFSYLRFFFSSVLLSFVCLNHVPIGDRVRRLAGIHALPALLLALIYFFSVRGMYVAGGQFGSSGEVLLNTLALVLGGTPLEIACTSLQTRANSVLAIVAIATALAGTYVLARGQRSVLLAILVALFVVPVTSGLLIEDLALFPRYFLPEVVLLYFVVAALCAELWSSKSLGKILAGIVASVIVFLNFSQGIRFVEYGRGGVLTALRTIAEAPQDSPQRVAALDNGRLGWLVDYYLVHAKLPGVLRNENEPMWILGTSRSSCPSPITQLRHHSENYVLVTSIPFWGLSGEETMLYRRE